MVKNLPTAFSAETHLPKNSQVVLFEIHQRHLPKAFSYIIEYTKGFSYSGKADKGQMTHPRMFDLLLNTYLQAIKVLCKCPRLLLYLCM